MSLDPYLHSIVIRSRLEEMRRQAARRELIRQAAAAKPRARRRSIIPTVVRAFSIAWLRDNVEGEALP